MFSQMVRTDVLVKPRQLRSVSGTGRRACRTVAALLLATMAAPAALAQTAQAKVVDSTPIYETVNYSVPREVCRLERTAYDGYRDDYRNDYDDRRGRRVSRTPPIVGAIIGGALGNAVGNGRKNRRIGTAVGAILGGSIGADVARRNSRNRTTDGYSSRQPAYTTQRVCRVEEDYRSEEQVVGYQVTYAYAGETYRTTLPEDPGPYLDIHVQITPAVL